MLIHVKHKHNTFGLFRRHSYITRMLVCFSGDEVMTTPIIMSVLVPLVASSLVKIASSTDQLNSNGKLRA